MISNQAKREKEKKKSDKPSNIITIISLKIIVALFHSIGNLI